MATMVQTPVRSDSMIRESVISELKRDPKLATSADVAVAVKEGAVTLPALYTATLKKTPRRKRLSGLRRQASSQRYRGQDDRDANGFRDRQRSGAGDPEPRQPACRKIKATVEHGGVKLEGTAGIIRRRLRN